MNAPERFAAWLAANAHVDKKHGHTFHYHPRSDAHSIALCRFLLDDLLQRCGALRGQMSAGRAAYGINIPHTWPASHKKKTLDLAIGRPKTLAEGTTADMPEAAALDDVFLACEAKSVMTEHIKSQPRVYDELSSSHEIVHQGRQDAIAAGITIINISQEFASPLRQTDGLLIAYSKHKQPHAAERMVRHLRGLPVRGAVGEVGFDAYCTVVVDCDNVHDASLWTAEPSP